ncbi:MAG: hypothetical protein JF615_06120 [Asticcacaulis sp.]|nr:hypothetical protein [Asticcacaulis sp.]
MNDRYDAQPVADFPTEAAANHDFLFWTAVTVCLIVLASILTIVFKNAQRDASGGVGTAIDRRVDAVKKLLSSAARAGPDEQFEKATAARAAIADNFQHTLKLSAELNKVVGKLNTAIDGTKEEVYKPKGAMPAAAGGTVINIAVNASEVQPMASAAPAAPADIVVAEKVPMTADEKSEAVWKAVQKLFNYWKNMSAVATAFRAAQAQLMTSPAWEDPREEPASSPKARK